MTLGYFSAIKVKAGITNIDAVEILGNLFLKRPIMIMETDIMNKVFVQLTGPGIEFLKFSLSA